MDKFNLIGVRVYQNKELIRTRYFKIGKLKEAIEYASDMPTVETEDGGLKII